MILELVGHDYKYACEQAMLMLWPEQRPEYGTAGADLSARITLKRSRVYATAHTRVFAGETVCDGVARVRLDTLTDEVLTNRHLSRILKLSFYKAGIAATGKAPVWGALTGVRPGKLAVRALSQGATSAQARRMLERDYFVTPARAALCCATAERTMAVKNALEDRDCCLYVGIPFCPTRCAYCSFVSNSIEKSSGLIPPFLAALDREIDASAAIVRQAGLRIVSVYIGGGTPTTLEAGQLARLLERLHGAFDLSGCREFTVEAGRPDTITREKLLAIKNGGATRISINPQTMSDAVLAAIGRRHSADDVRRAYDLARQVDAGAVNMDLIAGLPADDPAGFRRSLDTVMALSPENITVHTLALKKGAAITLGGTPIPDGAQVGAMVDYAAAALSGRGYSPYYLYRQKFMSGGFENVGWTRPGFENLYNICIMEELCSIIALGGGGSTKLIRPGESRIRRIFNAKYPREYIDGIAEYIRRKDGILTFYEAK
ncbi:MAG: coproporphyrinogen dehydrogenase HemZ [Oscillospiraceae bacterium]|nr:coproporphyrinogen dehydrogenase HemZ [Oscillospiraceae bacterium]